MGYAETLEEEIRRMKDENPKIQKLINAVSKNQQISSMDIDYMVEKDFHLVKSFYEILNDSAPEGNFP
jgi:acyl-CoA thioesterase